MFSLNPAVPETIVNIVRFKLLSCDYVNCIIRFQVIWKGLPIFCYIWIDLAPDKTASILMYNILTFTWAVRLKKFSFEVRPFCIVSIIMLILYWELNELLSRYVRWLVWYHMQHDYDSSFESAWATIYDTCPTLMFLSFFKVDIILHCVYNCLKIGSRVKRTM